MFLAIFADIRRRIVVVHFLMPLVRLFERPMLKFGLILRLTLLSQQLELVRVMAFQFCQQDF